MPSRVVLVVLGFVILGCQQALSTPSEVSARELVLPAVGAQQPATEAEVLQLHFDERVSVGALHLRWLDLNDSRCPQGVQCVWEGQAVATVEFSRDDLPPDNVELTLHPGVETVASTAAGHELRLLAVEPYPREGVTPERSEHVATLEIRPL